MKKSITRIIVITLCLASLLCFVSCQKESEYTITYYNNKGIYFKRYGSGEERIYIKYQDNTIYKVDKISGEYPPEPEPPTNQGYIFLGWYQNPECTIEFLFGHYEINSDINLYAKWYID
jgi:uncharacterized repeat protein (TIGR02543 family)